jgi:hypothetical protein
MKTIKTANSVKTATLDTAKATGAFVKNNADVLTFVICLTFGGIGGFWLGTKTEPMQTSIQKFGIFTKGHTLKLSNKEVLDIYGKDGRFHSFVVNNEDYYFISGVPFTAANFEVALEKSDLKVAYKGIAIADSVLKSDKVKPKILVPQEQKQFRDDDGNPASGILKGLLKNQKEEQDSVGNSSWGKSLLSASEVLNVEYRNPKNPKEQAGTATILLENEGDRLAALRLVEDIKNSGFEANTEVHSGKSGKIETPKVALANEYQVSKFDFYKNSFFGRFDPWAIGLLGACLGILSFIGIAKMARW